MNLDQITLKGAARLAGGLGPRGDGELLRTALGLAGGPLWQPGAAAATVTVENGSEAAFTLHSPHLGAVEARIRLDAAGVWAAVTTPPGPMTERAAATLPDLVAGLERATGRTGIASVQARRGGGPGRCSRKVGTMTAPEQVPDVVSPPPAAASPELYQAVAEALVLAYRLTGGEAPR